MNFIQVPKQSIIFFNNYSARLKLSQYPDQISMCSLGHFLKQGNFHIEYFVVNFWVPYKNGYNFFMVSNNISHIEEC